MLATPQDQLSEVAHHLRQLQGQIRWGWHTTPWTVWTCLVPLMMPLVMLIIMLLLYHYFTTILLSHYIIIL